MFYKLDNCLVWVDDDGRIRHDIDDPDSEAICVLINYWTSIVVVDIENKRASRVMEYYNGPAKITDGPDAMQICGWESDPATIGPYIADAEFSLKRLGNNDGL